MKTASWVVIQKSTGTVIGEFYSPKIVALVNREKYDVMPILDYLVSINGQNKA
jgi:hypothetical protein